jgi:hypothetical protein
VYENPSIRQLYNYCRKVYIRHIPENINIILGYPKYLFQGKLVVITPHWLGLRILDNGV